jgi:hypothetical protein
VAGTGTADLRSQTDYLCFHQEPRCARPTQSWTVHVVAWETTPTPLTTPSSSTPTGTPYPVTVVVGLSADASTVNLHVGDVLQVGLPANYDPLTLTGSALTAHDSTGGFNTQQPPQPLLAHFVATGAGTADLFTQTDMGCERGPTVCPVMDIPWRLHVVVT